jgi:acylphosphatase
VPQLHAIVHGHVQGVSFRYYTRMKAYDLDLTGWVRNVPDGSVEVMAVGPREALDEFEEWLHHGPPGARVTKVIVNWIDVPQSFTAFEIRYG